MKITNPEIFRQHAEFCKTLANPTRLMVLALLQKQELSVGELVEGTGVRLATVSQHLKALRLHNIVKTRKDGQRVYYSLSDPRLVEACVKIREVLLDQLKSRGLIAQEVNVDDLVQED
jgi:ArsR family transcriptional regulator